MGKITVTNKTDSAVAIEWRNGQARVEPRCKQTIEAEKDSPIRIYNDETPSKLCFGRCLSRESVKDVWRFGPVALIGAFMRGSKPPVLPGERERAERQ